jgi:hyperosmotically inducible protein
VATTRPGCSVRLSGGLVVLAVLLAACAPATSATRDDPTIATHVKIALLNDPQVGALRLDAHVSQGVVTLSGSVSTQADADRAVAVARKVGGVKDVRSELVVGSLQSAVLG